MKLDDAKPLTLQVECGPSIELGGVDVERELDTSYLRRLVDTSGAPVRLIPGTRVTLLSGGSVLFVGIVQEDSSVKDFLSCSSADGEYEDL